MTVCPESFFNWKLPFCYIRRATQTAARVAPKRSALSFIRTRAGCVGCLGTAGIACADRPQRHGPSPDSLHPLSPSCGGALPGAATFVCLGFAHGEKGAATGRE